MKIVLHRLALRVYRHLPVRVRRLVVRMISPSYTVGAMVLVERDDGALLLVRHSYRHRWGVPGGLLERGEPASSAATREVREETGLTVTLIGEPAVVVSAEPQRVDLIFRARLAGPDASVAEPSSPEITDCRWFDPEELPELQHETSQAFVALARSARAPQARPMMTAFDRWSETA